MKPVHWIGSSLDDLREFPAQVQDDIGYALYRAQTGGKHPHAKPLKGFGSAGVLEIVEDHDGESYRAVYTVRLVDAVYVLHVFQKKARHGIATPKSEIELVHRRLKEAQQSIEGTASMTENCEGQRQRVRRHRPTRPRDASHQS